MDYQRCTRCILDTTIPNIHFDENGICNFCKIHDELEKEYPAGAAAEEALGEIVERIKQAGKGKDYDCVVGVSGGRDSTYTLYLAVKYGLRPLAVHFDNGWNSEIAVTNIKNAITTLHVDLETIVADWEEFKSLQRSFLMASVSDSEIPTDVAIFGTLHKVAARENIRYIINGHSFRTEGIVPLTWTYMDGRYINSVHKMFGGKPLKTVPNFTMWDMFYYTFIKPVKVIPLLNYVDYDHDVVNQLLEKEVGWTYYGGHHHESYYTRFFQSFYLPQKFNIDKRLLELSAKIRTGAIQRDAALEEIKKPYQFSEELIDYAISKLGITNEEFQKILAADRKSFMDYPTYYPFVRLFKTPVKIAASLGWVPNLLYYKFFA